RSAILALRRSPDYPWGCFQHGGRVRRPPGGRAPRAFPPPASPTPGPSPMTVPRNDSGNDTDATTFGIIGLGYVGLPLAVEAAEAGIRVIGFDVNPKVTEGINEGRSHIQDVPSEDVAALMGKGLLEATTDMSRL